MRLFNRIERDDEVCGYTADAINEIIGDDSDELLFCSWCGREIHGQNIYGNAFDHVLCENCQGKIPCGFCGDVYNPRDLKEINGDFYCENCQKKLKI